MKEIIAFHVNHFSLRGSEVAIYDYAHHNENILNNESIIVVHNNFRNKLDYRGIPVHNEDVYKKFQQRFTILEYSLFSDLQTTFKTHNITIFYNLKSGENDNQLVPGVKNVSHCVFTYNKNNAHGDIYIPISPTIVDSPLRSITPHVPHIIEIPTIKENLRKELSIPKDAIVFGRHGGEETFNIPFVIKTVEKVARENKNIYFLFLNTQPFGQSQKNIIFLRGLSDTECKTKFINTCDAMLHARKEGESFGIAVAEFSVLKKPVFTWKHPVGDTKGLEIDVEHFHHIDTLGKDGFYYTDEHDLYKMIIDFKKFICDDELDCYSRLYSPQIVMALFDKHIIKQKNSIYNFVSIKEFEDMKYICFDDDQLSKTLDNSGWENHVFNVIKKLLNPGDTFIDIGSNIGYHTLRSAKLNDVKVVSVEPQKDIFSLLNYNVINNNLKNVICLNTGIDVSHKTKYMSQLLSKDTNMGNIMCNDVQNDKDDEMIQCIDMDYIFQLHKNIKVIKIDVCGNELNVLKGGILLLLKQRPFVILPLESYVCEQNGYTCETIKNLLNVLNYTMIEINSEYPCDHLCCPNEKVNDVNNLFDIQENTINNKVNNNLSMGITKSIKFTHTKTITTLENKITKVKLMCNWTTSKDLCECWNKMSKENCKWNDIQLTHEDDNIDYYVIINKPLPTDKYIPNKTIVFRMEPDTETSVRWNDWYKSKDEFMHFLDLSKYRNNSEWHLGLNYNQIKTINIEKTKTLSTVVSSLYNMEGHKKRIDFVKYLQSNDVDIDVYGRDNVFLLENHKGELPYHNKNNGILPYKYTFIAENCKLDNYFTEKIIDSIIGETLCFYWGCPNIEKFIDSKAFIRLDLDDFQQSLNVVQQAIENDEWSKRINIIKQEKEKIVNHYSFFPRIEGLIAISKLDCKVVNLNRRQDRWLKFQSEAKKVDFKNYKRFIAVDGENMIITSDTINMFRNFFNKPKKGEVGCALSHYNIWKEIENDTLVLEDDIKFDSNFIDGLALVYRHILDIKLDYDVVFIGYHLNKDVMNSITIQDIQNNKEIIVSMAEISKHKTTEHMFGYHGGGTFGYIISQKGAKKLLKSIEKRGFVWPVDYHMLLTTNSTFENDTVNMYCVTNPLVFSDMYEKNKTVDTDIQNTSYLF